MSERGEVPHVTEDSTNKVSKQGKDCVRERIQNNHSPTHMFFSRDIDFRARSDLFRILCHRAPQSDRKLFQIISFSDGPAI